MEIAEVVEEVRESRKVRSLILHVHSVAMFLDTRATTPDLRFAIGEDLWD